MNKINIPIKPTSIIVSRIGLLSELKYGLSIEANNITMAILMKLFDINIVASNLLGLSRSESILDINLLSPCAVGFLNQIRLLLAINLALWSTTDHQGDQANMKAEKWGSPGLTGGKVA